MNAIIIILSCIAGLVITYLLAIQFYKLGQLLKSEYPIIFRIYIIFWIFMLAIAFLVCIAVLYDMKEKHELKKEKAVIHQELQQLASTQDFQKRLAKVRKDGYSDKDILLMIKNSQRSPEPIKKAQKKWMSDKEIAESLGLDIE